MDQSIHGRCERVNEIRPLGRVDNSWVNLRRLGNQAGGILEPFVLVIILS